MTETVERFKVHFRSGDAECAAWHYPGGSGGCVIMAAGLGVPKEVGTDRLARRFAAAGFSVLAFDYRRFGESGGHPRQVFKVNEQLEDWQAAIGFARTLPEVDPKRLAIWGFSSSGGHVFQVAARNPDLAAAISHAGSADCAAAFRHAVRYVTPGSFLRLSSRAVIDVIARRLGRPPLLIPLSGPRGTVALINTPDSLNGPEALNPGQRHPWQMEIAAGSVLRFGFYRPGRVASQIAVPLLVMAYESDGVTLPGPSIKAARKAPRSELVRLPGGHYQAFIAGMDRALDAMLPFLRRHLLDGSPPDGDPQTRPSAAEPALTPPT